MIRQLIIPLGFAAAFLATGAAIWPLAYSKIALPNSLFGLPLWVVFGAALFSNLVARSGWFLSAAVVGSAPLLAIFARVIVDTMKDPTSHNLWPIALVLAGIFTFPCAALGAGLVSLFRFIRNRNS